jgi:hypothetical protein
MPEDIITNPTDQGILRPNAPPLRTKGEAFIPINLPDFGFQITLLEDASPNNPITLFTIYYPLEIIDIIVKYTNNYIREPNDNSCPYARVNS